MEKKMLSKIMIVWRTDIGSVLVDWVIVIASAVTLCTIAVRQI